MPHRSIHVDGISTSIVSAAASHLFQFVRPMSLRHLFDDVECARS